jgi:DNA-directed RNA polymerase subunit RPC12/RpoP
MDTQQNLWERIYCAGCSKTVEAVWSESTAPRCPHCGSTFHLYMPAPPDTTPGGQNQDLELRDLISRMLSDSDRSREQIAEQMTRLLGRAVSKNMLDRWASPGCTDGWRFPLENLIPLEIACGSDLLSRWLANRRGGRYLHGADALHADLGRINARMAALQAQAGRIHEHLGRHAH